MTQPKTDLAYLRNEKAKAEQKLRSCQHRERILERQMSELNRRERVHRLCTRAGMLESFLVCPGELTDDQVMEILKIVIDSSLAGFHNTGVRNFTLAHEIGHQLLHIYYPLLALSDQLEEDCADIIAEGLLLPECLVRASMAFFQFPDTLSHISRSQLDMNYPSFKKMARQLGVQRQLLANRMKYLHILTSDVPYRHTLSLMEAG